MTDQVKPIELTCEYAKNPLGIDTPQPRFGWVLESAKRGCRQTAYQLLLSSSEEKLKNNIGDKWDSGKVTSDESVNITYQGTSLVSGEKCYWKVRIWNQDEDVSPYSSPVTFEMGLMQPNDWQGQWIGAEKGISAPLIRKEFAIEKTITKARVYICGLGFYELYINGSRVGNHVLDPATTDYDKRILYVPYDVTHLLKEGRNVVGVILGNGWFCEPPEFDVVLDRRMGYKYGDSPRVIIQMNLAFSDGSSSSIVTDRRWRTSSGPIVKNDLYGGETYDARLEKPGWDRAGYDDSGWVEALAKQDPGGTLAAQMMPAIKVIQTKKPVNLTNPKAGIYVYDFGQLFGGWVRLHVKGPPGTKITIKYSARISKDSGLIDMRRHPSPKETDFYILRGNSEEVYEPRFTFHPVRYVQIEGFPGKPTEKDLQGRVVHSDFDRTESFHCSNALLNQIHQNVRWTLTNGLFGIPLDCLHREHWAWTDPATITGTLYPRKYMPLFWTKWLKDIQSAQDEKGQIPDIAPNYVNPRAADDGQPGEFVGDPAWGGNYPILVWYLYQYYGDERLLKEHYQGMKRCVDYLGTMAQDHIVSGGHYGDHMLPGEAPGKEEFISSETPPPLVWTGYYYRGAATVAQTAKVLGYQKDSDQYARLAEEIKQSFNKKWLDKDSCQYATGSQTANVFPLALGIVPQESVQGVVENLTQTIIDKHQGHLHTGNTGTTCLIDTLTSHGQGEVMLRMVSQTSYPGWGFMVAEGATTIWESWSLEATVGNSESMIMWATIDEFFYNDLAGIKGPDYYGPDMMSPGFKDIRIEPHPLADLDQAAANIKTVRGLLSSSWKRQEDSLTLEVTIPSNSRALIRIPKLGMKKIKVTESKNLIWQDGRYLAGAEGITAGQESSEFVSFQVGSGTYTFHLTGQ